MASPKRRAVRWAPAKAPATRPPLRRLLWALQRLRAGKPVRATDLAREFEVALRTAYRDFEFLRDDWRVPLEYDHHKGTYTLTKPMAALPLVSLSHGELGRRLMSNSFEPDLASALWQDPGAAAGGGEGLAREPRCVPVAGPRAAVHAGRGRLPPR